MKTKKIEFTEEELRTLIWAVNNQYHRNLKERARTGNKKESDAEKRLLLISKKVYSKLTEGRI